MSLKNLLNTPRPTVRADLGPIMPAITAAKRAAAEYHDAVLNAQAAETPTGAAAIEQTQQTMGAMVRELGVLVEQVRKVQTIDDQLTRVLADLRGASS